MRCQGVRILAASGPGGMARLWETLTAKEACRIVGHRVPVELRWEPRGRVTAVPDRSGLAQSHLLNSLFCNSAAQDGLRTMSPAPFKLGELMKAIRVAASSAEKLAMPEDQGSEVWLANAPLTGASLSVIHLLLHPGQSGGRHRHPNADEVICLFRGTVRVHTPTEAILLQPGDGLTVLAGLTHQIKNVGSEDAEMSLSYSSGDRRYVAE